MAKITRKSVNVDSEEVQNDNEEQAETTERSARVTRSAVSSGWGAKPEERAETIKAPVVKLKDNGTRILKLLNGEPAVKYKRHYLNSKGRYFTCTQNQCPLCAEKVRASWTFIMNAVDMADDATEVKTWTFGTEVSSQLQNIAEDKEVKLDDEGSYFEVKHVKVAGRTAPGTNVSFIRSRYLMEEHGIQPLNEDELAELSEERYGAEVVWINDNDYLEGIAAEVLDSDRIQPRKKD